LCFWAGTVREVKAPHSRVSDCDKGAGDERPRKALRYVLDPVRYESKCEAGVVLEAQEGRHYTG